MYMLDTNAFYWYFGRDKLFEEKSSDAIDVNKYRNVLDGTPFKALSATSYQEAFVHFRNDATVLREFIEFIAEKDLRVYNSNPYFIIKEGELDSVMQMNKRELHQYAYSMLDRKIFIEAIFSRYFFMIVEITYLEMKMREEHIPEKHFKAAVNFFKSDKHEDIFRAFNEALVNGYKNNNEERSLKKVYSEKLDDTCNIIDMLVKMYPMLVKSCENDVDVDIGPIISEERERFLDERGKDENYTMNLIAEVVKRNRDFEEEVKLNIQRWMNQLYKMESSGPIQAFCKLQLDYICDVMLSSWLDNSQKFHKNDIYDMLFLNCITGDESQENKKIVEDTKIYLISFDHKLRDFIKSNLPENGKVINSFYVGSEGLLCR